MTVLERKTKYTTGRLVDQIEVTSTESTRKQRGQQWARKQSLFSALKTNTDLCLKATELRHAITE